MVDSNPSWLRPALDLQKSLFKRTTESWSTAVKVSRDLQSQLADVAVQQLNRQLQLPRVELKLFRKTARRFLVKTPPDRAPRPGSAEEDNAGKTASGEPMDLDDINGIGPSYAEKLRAAGIENAADLAESSPSEIVGVLDTGLVTEEKASGWIQEAAGR